jgi:hypothetical protein
MLSQFDGVQQLDTIFHYRMKRRVQMHGMLDGLGNLLERL